MRPRRLSPTPPTDRGQDTPRRRRLIGLATFSLVCGLAFSMAGPAGAAIPERLMAGCGWNASTPSDRAFYEHCATNTNVWIQVTRWPRSDYHRCVGPGKTVLDSDATGAWYDSNYRGGLCGHPGDTGP